MKRIIGERGTGKTRQLMEYAQKVNAIFVCYNPYAMHQKALEYGITGLTFIDYAEWKMRMKEDREEKYVVDELDRLLNRYNLVGYTATEG